MDEDTNVASIADWLMITNNVDISDATSAIQGSLSADEIVTVALQQSAAPQHPSTLLQQPQQENVVAAVDYGRGSEIPARCTTTINVILQTGGEGIDRCSVSTRDTGLRPRSRCVGYVSENFTATAQQSVAGEPSTVAVEYVGDYSSEPTEASDDRGGPISLAAAAGQRQWNVDRSSACLVSIRRSDSSSHSLVPSQSTDWTPVVWSDFDAVSQLGFLDNDASLECLVERLQQPEMTSLAASDDSVVFDSSRFDLRRPLRSSDPQVSPEFIAESESTAKSRGVLEQICGFEFADQSHCDKNQAMSAFQPVVDKTGDQTLHGSHVVNADAVLVWNAREIGQIDSVAGTVLPETESGSELLSGLALHKINFCPTQYHHDTLGAFPCTRDVEAQVLLPASVSIHNDEIDDDTECQASCTAIAGNSMSEQKTVAENSGTMQPSNRLVRRREQNRRAARNSRAKKRAQSLSVVTEYNHQHSLHTSLTGEIQQLQREKDALSKILADHAENCQFKLSPVTDFQSTTPTTE